MRSQATRLKISKTFKRLGIRPPNAIKGQAPKNFQRIQKLAWKANRGIKRTVEWKMRMSKMKRGANGSNWRGGMTPLRKSIRALSHNKIWTQKVFKRDKYTCQLCGATGVYIQADHYPKMFAEIIYENEIKTIEMAVACKKLWDIKNGRTLCIPCHKKYGRRTLALEAIKEKI